MGSSTPVGSCAMGECVCRIEKLENGYEVSLMDPKIEKANNERKKDDEYRWRDPMRSFAFETAEGVIKFLTDNLDKIEMPDDYTSSFKMAAKDMGD